MYPHFNLFDGNLLKVMHTIDPQVPSEWSGEHHSLCGDRSSVCTDRSRSVHRSAALPGVCRVSFRPHRIICAGSSSAQQGSVLGGGNDHNLLHGLQGARYSSLSVKTPLHCSMRQNGRGQFCIFFIGFILSYFTVLCAIDNKICEHSSVFCMHFQFFAQKTLMYYQLLLTNVC